MCNHATPHSSTLFTTARQADSLASATTMTNSKFESQVKPILEAQCKPCHFPGGAQYQRLPFDRPETIKKLGTKLFTRIKKEDDRRVIREFLAEP
jgi:hypothetical protein